MSNRTPTAEQQAILDLFLSSGENLQIEARAGTGKTTMLTMLARHAPPSTIALAFNKRMADELRERMTNAQVKTLNGFGHGVLMSFLPGKVTPKAGRLVPIVTKVVKDLDERDAWFPIHKLTQMAKVHGILPTSAPGVGKGLMPDELEVWDEMATLMNIDLEDYPLEFLVAQARKVLNTALRQAFTGEIDFDDQIYIPVCYRLPLPSPDLLMVDEAQDLNPIQIEMVKRSKPRRLVCVGDPKQAIYQFRGADADAFTLLGDTFSCSRLPLTISFRCASRIIEKAQEYVSDIKPRPDAPRGRIWNHREWGLDLFGPGDAVLCRQNSPLFGLAFTMLRHRKPFRFYGQDFTKGLKSVIKKIGGAYSAFPANLERWKDQETARAIERETNPETIHDKAACLHILHSEAQSFEEMNSFLDEIFGRNSSGAVLTTIHRAKGFEWERVFWLDSHKAISTFSQEHGGWSLEQDTNCCYVAITRAINELHFIYMKGLEE